MKKILIIALMMTSPLAIADDVCVEISGLAKTVMKLRQDGFDMAKIMSIVDKDQEIKDVSRQIVISAYESNRYSTDSYKKAAIDDFSNEWYLACLSTTK